MQYKKNEDSVPNIWTAQENAIHFYKVASATLGGVVFLLIISLLVSLFRDPIVIIKTGTRKEYFAANREKVEIGKNEVSEFTRQYVSAMYTWTNFDHLSLKKELEPLVEQDLLEKIISGQIQRYSKDLKNKKISQAVTSIDVEVMEDKVVSRFDRVLRIEGIPFVVPTQLTLSMIQGPSTMANPMGIYVSGLVEYEGTK